MTQPPPSLLVLAWDDTDPSAHAADATPTLPVLRQLATHQTLLAVLPELPEVVHSAAYQAEVVVSAATPTTEEAASSPASEPAPDATPTSEAGAEAQAIDFSPPALSARPANGTTLLPLPAANQPVGPRAPVAASRIVGLAELEAMPTEPPAAPVPQAARLTGPQPANLIPALPTARPTAPTLWPSLPAFAHTSPRSSQAWDAPAAPYVGSSAALAGPELVGRAEAAALQVSGSELGASVALSAAIDATFEAPLPEDAPHSLPATEPTPAAGLPLLAEAPAAPAAAAPAAAHEAVKHEAVDEFAQTSAEVGPEEAADLDAPEDDLTLAPEDANSAWTTLPEAPQRASLAQGLQALHRPAVAASEPALFAPAEAIPAAETVAQELAESLAPAAIALSDNLHYRIIQYARFATHVATEQGEEFGAIYAPDWPTWLAALEIRHRSRRPLVLHVMELAILAPAAEHGWRTELERYALRRAHTVLVATEALRRQVQKHYGPLRVHVIAPDDEVRINAVLAKVSG